MQVGPRGPPKGYAPAPSHKKLNPSRSPTSPLARAAVSAYAQELARLFLSTSCLPPKAARDAVHLAVATAIAADYLLTWNCRHLANAQILKRLEREAQRAGRPLPHVCTPLELMGDLPYENESAS